MDERQTKAEKGECSFQPAADWLGTNAPRFCWAWRTTGSCLLLKDFSSTPLVLVSLSFSFSLPLSLHLSGSLPHQLFSSHTGMTPQGNVIPAVRARAGPRCPHTYCILQVPPTEATHLPCQGSFAAFVSLKTSYKYFPEPTCTEGNVLTPQRSAGAFLMASCVVSMVQLSHQLTFLSLIR